MMINCNNLILAVLVFVYMLLSSVCIAQPEENDTIYIDTENDEQNNFENKTLRKNSIYFELFGNGLIYSLGYERIIWSKDIHKLSTAIGFSYQPPFTHDGSDTYYFIPSEINYLIGKKHHFELGLGITFPLHQKNVRHISDIGYVLFSRIGYRYQKEEGGELFRIGFTPFKAIDPSPYWNFPIMPWGGITAGWTF